MRTILRYSENTGSVTEVYPPAPSPCQVSVKCTLATENVLLVGILGSWQLRVSKLMETGLVYVCVVSAVIYRPVVTLEIHECERDNTTVFDEVNLLLDSVYVNNI